MTNPLTHEVLKDSHVLVVVTSIDTSCSSDLVPAFVDAGPGISSMFELTGKAVGWPLAMLSGEHSKKFIQPLSGSDD